MEQPVLKNVESGHLIPILKSPFVIGRGLTSDYIIPNKVVSRAHCSFEKTAQGWVLKDLSTNGTMVNDEVYKNVVSPVLMANDEICLGYQAYTYKFMMNYSKGADTQVEKLKNEEISMVPNNRSPGTPNSFDENGISDDVLNRLADDMLAPIEPVVDKVVVSPPSTNLPVNTTNCNSKEKAAKSPSEDGLSTILDFVLDNQNRIEVTTSNSTAANHPSTSNGYSSSYQTANQQLRQAHLQRELLKKNQNSTNIQSNKPSVSSTIIVRNSLNNVNTTVNTVVVSTNNESTSVNGNKRLKLDTAAVPVVAVQPPTTRQSYPRIKIIKTSDGKFYSTIQQMIPISVVNQAQSTSHVEKVPCEAGPSTSSVTVPEAKKNTEPEKPANKVKATDNEEPEKNKKQNQTPDQNHFEQMEDELMCTICANLFIKAVTLGCSHSFCQYCISMWKKKKSDCPICRKQIMSTIRTLVLDNIIDKMLESAPQEMRDQRKEAMAERTKIEAEIEAAKNPPRNTGRNTARRGRRQNNRRQAANAPGPSRIPTPDPVAVIELESSSDSSLSDSWEEYDEDYFNTPPDVYDLMGIGYYNSNGAYYGGYGRCYNCGDRGHWANRCPYR